MPSSGSIRSAFDDLVVAMRRAYGEADVCIAPAATQERIAEVEAARGIVLPSDYRAFLELHDGASFGVVLAILGTDDLQGDTSLATRAKEFVTMSAEYGGSELLACLPIANLGQPNDWVLYDPDARRYLYCLNADRDEEETFAAVLARVARVVAAS